MKMAEMNLNNIPARALNVSSRLLLSKLLNPRMEIATSKHLCRDYRGLAEIIGYDHMDIRNFERSNDPTQKILEEWEADSTNTVGDLIELLTTIERFDVIDDMQPLFERDATSYLQRRQRLQEAPLQVAEISSNPMEPMVYENPDILTIEDMSLQQYSGGTGSVAYYDAYVCYDMADFQFVKVLSEYLESEQIGLKLCIKDRDLIAGVQSEYEALVRLIEERCNRMLIILSPEFLLSEECKFQTRYAAGLAVAQRNRKLIPLVYKSCQMPQLLRFISKVDFTKADVHEWIWKKLVVSIKGTVTNSFTLPSSQFCSSLYTASQMSCIDANYTQYPLMLPAPTRSRSRSCSPQPSISFPPSTSSALPPSSLSSSSVVTVPPKTLSLTIPCTPSQQTKITSPLQRHRWLPKIGRFGSSSAPSTNSTSGNQTSGFHSQSEEQLSTSGQIFEQMV